MRSEAWPGPSLDRSPSPFGEPGRHCVRDLKTGNDRGATARVLTGLLEALDEDAIEFRAELAAKAVRVGKERQPVNRARQSDAHLFDSGISR